MKKARAGAPGQRGFTILEIMITLVVTATGLLGLASLMSRTSAASLETAMRSRATVYLQDMVDRISSNRSGDWNEALGMHGNHSHICPAPVNAINEACRWGNILAGTEDNTEGSTSFGYRGCLVALENAPDGSGHARTIQVTVAWASPKEGVAPPDTCGQGELTEAGRDDQRRTVSAVVRLPLLSSKGLGTVDETATHID